MTPSKTLQDAAMECLRTGFVQVGRATPESLAGDVFVSAAMVFQVGEAEVRRMVRQQYEAAHRASSQARKRPA